MTNIDVKYEAWKNKLLDLGKRNRLLNYKDTARSNVKIEYPECSALYNMFVKEEKNLVFPLECDEENKKIKLVSNIKTNKNNNDLQKALRNLRNRARTAIQEQGVNVLYLSFGFLKWTEAEDSNYIFTSPLILVPVTLTIESISSPYILTLHEDEIVVNPTLIYKLENDFGITLPTFDENDDIDEFLLNVENSITLNNWTVTKDVGLSLLSFLKINMYLDLNNHKESIITNPLVRAISGDTSAIKQIPNEMLNFDFDKQIKPSNVFQVVDADASQQAAIMMAKKGISFVLQGPPGTGKSQTITNIIAESLAEGKKVLFVSEKMAALDVVYRRLASVGLEDFCLVLHSYKANKKNVIEQLSKVLDLSYKKNTLSDEIFQKFDVLQADKEKLNAYAEQVHQIIEPLGKSIYEANGILANLDIYDDYIFSISDIRNVTKEQYNSYSYLLTQFANSIGKMTDDFKNNPWRECHLTSVSNEFRHDATSRLNTLLPKIKKFDEKIAEVFVTLHIDVPHTIQNIDYIIDLLKVTQSAQKIPSEWILSDEISPYFDEVTNYTELKKDFLSLSACLADQYKIIHSNESIVELASIDSLNNFLALKNEKQKLEALINSTKTYSVLNTSKIDNVTLLLSHAIETANVINSLKNEILDEYEPTIFELDYNGILGRIKTEYTSFTKIFKKEYKQDKKAIQFHRKYIVKNISDKDMLTLVEKLHRIDETRKWYANNANYFVEYLCEDVIDENTNYNVYQKRIMAFNAINNSINIINDMIKIFEHIIDKEQILEEHYKFLYNGILSDWEAINSALNWTISFKNSLSKINVSDSFIKAVCVGNEFINICQQEKEVLEEFKNTISFEYKWFVSNFTYPDIFDTIELSNLYNRLNACVNGLSLLEEWIDFSSTKAKCIAGGLGNFIEVIEQKNILSQNIIPIFKKRFFRLWLDAVLPDYPAVLNFRRKMHESTINEFISLDKMQFEIAKARIKSKLINDLPSYEYFVNCNDERSILNRELNKKRKIMPIRRLFKNIPNLLLTLKPCLMMSPLSVSLFLETETYKFDIVIFDEASQVCTENAIGAISRAKQVILAGDSKQLPPTNFFQAAISENDFDIPDDDDENDDSNAYESILDEANMLPEMTLRWHYRSKNESLIAFSNAKFYKNKLITFPSNKENVKNNGVEYIYVADGHYDRSGKKGNIIEANKVVDLVFKHFKEQPNLSLGVITFGEVQQQAIETVLRKRRIQNQRFEHFFAEDKEDAFFVKNLENVQGDERDTIIFSIGYAKDATGVFRMNFGPLSKLGGERRLNVAITRAKYNVKLVGSILPTDIDIDKISFEGPKLLRAYIDFAKNGQKVLEREITESDFVEHDSPFEEAVYNFLNRKGYKVVTQVGCSGYRIDMAVKHPTISGIYVLGIECDGATYHSSKTARERDRLRQDVLENMGWKIYHIWSTDWIKDPKTEGRRLVEKIENVITNYGMDEDYSQSNSKKFFQHTSIDNFVTTEEKDSLYLSSDNPYGFEKAEYSNFSSLSLNKYGDIYLDWIMEVVNKEYPIHYELLCHRLTSLYNNKKTTIKIRREIEKDLLRLEKKNIIIRKGNFIFPKDYDTIHIRMPNNRKIQYICIEEISEAMFRILQSCIGITRDALCLETIRVYGFNRTSQNISLAMSNAVDELISSGRIEEIDGKLKIIL